MWVCVCVYCFYIYIIYLTSAFTDLEKVNKSLAKYKPSFLLPHSEFSELQYFPKAKQRNSD